MAAAYPIGTFLAVTGPPPSTPPAAPRLRGVLAISSNKGGVGKTTLATNLAIYLRALREELPVALVGLDDQRVIDRMFALRELRPGEPNLKHGWAERSLDGVLQLGQYGIHFVPSPPDVSLLKARAEDPSALRRILERSTWQGLFILDTKSDLEALTRNAWFAADRILVPVADRSSLEEAGKLFGQLERARLPLARARVVFTLVDRRTRAGEQPLAQALEAEVRRRGWPRYETTLSRSPRVETLNSGGGSPLSILHNARGTAVHAEFAELAREVLRDFEGVFGGGSGEQPAVLWGRRLDRTELARRGGGGLSGMGSALRIGERRP
jgi:cellulose biosynthesis protein BcsQ